MRYEFHPEALAEYEASTEYYVERDPAVAEHFVAAVNDAIDRILDSPTRWRIIDEDVRRCLTQEAESGRRMPRMQVYLPAAMYERVKARGFRFSLGAPAEGRPSGAASTGSTRGN